MARGQSARAGEASRDDGNACCHFFLLSCVPSNAFGAADVLESIADTVLQLVLFQVEAKENESTLVRLDVAPLLSSIKFLVDLARRKAQRWTEVGEKKNQATMLKVRAQQTESMTFCYGRLTCLKGVRNHGRSDEQD